MKLGRRSVVGSVIILGLVVAAIVLASQFQSVANLPLEKPVQAEEPKKGLAAGEVDPRISRAYIFVGKTGFGHEHGVVGAVQSGTIDLGATQNAGEIVFNMRSFSADTPEARRYVGLQGTTDASTRQQVTANMLGASVLDVGRFPTATFKIASAVLTKNKSRSGKPQYQLDGKFTLHGETQPLRLIAEADEVQGKVHLRGSFAIFQTSFGIRPFSKAFGAVGVTNQLTIHGDIWLGKKG
ncbi:MAG: YceI family protein [Planctomycetaceae bacterium]|nr:YceI family protein [Planctomycetaceae bacterium]